MKKIASTAFGTTPWVFASIVGLNSVFLSSCGQGNGNQTIAATTEKGMLALVANGEDFVRQGFVSKDGWQINFDHVYVNFSDATAYQTESSFEPQKGDTKDSIQYQDKVHFLDTTKTSDLAAGEADAEPILISEVNVPVGFYNALSWNFSTANASSPIAGNTIALKGQATKEGQTINFDLGFNHPAEYICGEFVGEKRQGIVQADTPGQVEATFHFDHIFGDANTPSDDALNQDALGFQPLADLAVNESLELNETDLSTSLSPQNYQKLTEAVLGLGHVGEGHCVVSTSQ